MIEKKSNLRDQNLPNENFETYSECLICVKYFDEIKNSGSIL